MRRFSFFLILVILAQVVLPSGVAVGTSGPDIQVSTSSINFGNVPVGTFSSQVTVIVANIGDADLEIYDLEITGANDNQFFIASINATSPIIPPGESVSGNVQFAPTSIGVKTAWLVIYSNDPCGGTVHIGLKGTGTEPPDEPDIDVTPTSVTFTPSVIVGNTSPPETVTIRNIGTANLNIGTITLTGTNPGDFLISSDNASGKTLPPNTATTVQVKFKPTDTGARNANLQIPSNDPDEDPVNVPLSGTGVQPPPDEPDIDVNPTSITFTPSVTIGNTSAPETVTIRNTGTANLTIGTISLTGTNPGDFLISSDNASGKSLPPNTATTVQVQFKPTDTGSRNANLQIPSNDPDEDPVNVPLSGTGTTPPPDIQVSPLSIDFGDVYPGSKSGTSTVTITNIGGSNLNIGTISLKGYDPGHFEIVTDNASNKSLPPGVSTTVSVRFSPKTPGYKEAELQIPSDAQSGLAKVDLEGFGLPTEPGIWVNPDKLDFGSILVNSSSAPKTVTIMNTGTADLILGTIYLGGADAGHFTIVTDNASGKTLPPGTWVTVSVKFNPTGPYTRQAGLYIPNNVYTSDEYVLLKGWGIPIQPLITVDPYQIDFGAIQVGLSSSWRTVTITNVGTANLQIYNIVLQGFDAGHFQISSDNASGKTLPPGTATTISVRFSPGSEGYKTAELYIPNDDLDVWVDLEGTGYLGPSPEIDVSPMSVTFTPPVALGNTSAPETVTIRNVGTANLTIGTITLTGANPGDFLIYSDNTSGKTLTPGTATTVQVQFRPMAVNSRNASLKIPSNDSDENPTYVTLAGTGTAPDIDVTPTSVTFTPPVVLGNTSDPVTVTIRNTGTANLTIGTITLTGTNPGDFVVSSDNASGKTLPPNTATTVQIKFKPTDTGTRAGSLVIPSNDPDEDPVSVPLSGDGSPVPVPDIDVNPTAINFSPPVVLGNTTPAVTVTIRSTGTANLTIGTITLAGANPGDFLISSDNASGKSLPPGTATTVKVSFKPTDTGTRAGSLEIPSNDPDEDPVSVPLSGTGTEPDIDVNPLSVDFGFLLIGDTSAPRIVTVTNNGTANLTIGLISITGPDAPQFAIVSDNASSQVLVPGASANVSVNYTPSAAVLQSTNMTIPSNDPDENPVNVLLSGTGTTTPPEPDIDVNPPDISYGPVNVGLSSAAITITITNTGTANLVIGTITLAGANPGDFVVSSDNASGKTLPPGTATTVKVSFKPTTTGARNANLQIPSNDPDEATVDVTLSGTGTTSPTPTPPGGDSSPYLPTPRYFTVDFLGEITREVATDDGRPIKRMEAPSPDGTHLVEIEAYTGATDNTGAMVTLIEIREAAAPELPENTVLVGKAYRFKPQGTEFDKDIWLTLGYNVTDLPEYVVSVGAAYFTVEDGWIYLETETTSVAELGKLRAPVGHFTIFAVLATVSVPAPPEPTLPPEKPEPPKWDVTKPPSAPAMFKLSNLSVTVSITKFFENVSYIVRTGEDAFITVEVTNIGGQAGRYTAILIINGEERDSKEVALEPGQTETLTFIAADNEPGTYAVVIGDLSGDFLSKLRINWWLISGSTAALVLVIWLVWYLVRRKIHQPI